MTTKSVDVSDRSLLFTECTSATVIFSSILSEFTVVCECPYYVAYVPCDLNRTRMVVVNTKYQAIAVNSIDKNL
jgi:hypothetical protein